MMQLQCKRLMKVIVLLKVIVLHTFNATLQVVFKIMQIPGNSSGKIHVTVYVKLLLVLEITLCS